MGIFPQSLPPQESLCKRAATFNTTKKAPRRSRRMPSVTQVSLRGPSKRSVSCNAFIQALASLPRGEQERTSTEAHVLHPRFADLRSVTSPRTSQGPPPLKVTALEMGMIDEETKAH